MDDNLRIDVCNVKIITLALIIFPSVISVRGQKTCQFKDNWTQEDRTFTIIIVTQLFTIILLRRKMYPGCQQPKDSTLLYRYERLNDEHFYLNKDELHQSKYSTYSNTRIFSSIEWDLYSFKGEFFVSNFLTICWMNYLHGWKTEIF